MTTRKLLGNLLIITSFIILGLTYYPLWQLLIPSKPPASLGSAASGYILIPKISAWAPLVENVDPYNKDQYRSALSHGVAISQGSAQIGSTGNLFLFAHSSEEPWRITRYNVAFLRLGQLKTGDEIIIGKNDQQYRFLVTGSMEVWPSEITYLTNPRAPLTLMTCTPLGTSLKRLLVFAQPS